MTDRITILEQRWEMMFKIFNWNFEYKPLKLNGWTPNFVIYGDKGNEILVNIEDYSSIDKFSDIKITEALNDVDPTKYDILFLGNTLPKSKNYDNPFIGWLSDLYADTNDRYFGLASMNYYNKKWGLFNEEGSYFDRILGIGNGDTYRNLPPKEKVMKFWKAACYANQ